MVKKGRRQCRRPYHFAPSLDLKLLPSIMPLSTPERAFFKRNMKLFDYIQETRAELKHVAWPTQEQTIVFTGLVVLFSIVISLYIGVWDFVFSRGLEMFVLDRPLPTSPVSIEQATTTTPAFNVIPGDGDISIEQIEATTTKSQ